MQVEQKPFKLHSEYKPTGDRPQAIAELVEGFQKGNQFQTLLGVTGSGKTFTMANVIAALNKPTLVIAHNKTLVDNCTASSRNFSLKTQWSILCPNILIKTVVQYVGLEWTRMPICCMWKELKGQNGRHGSGITVNRIRRGYGGKSNVVYGAEKQGVILTDFCYNVKEKRESEMQKKTPDYDNVFKTMKMKHKRLFVSVINDVFKKDYPADVKVEMLPSEGYLTESETADGSKKIEEQISDFLIRIEDDIYLLECQSYDDSSMAIRIAEYAFLSARQSATWNIGYAVIPMPQFSVIYIKRTDKTPKTTKITFTFPNGQTVDYESDNVILDDLTKEDIIEKRLFPYIPFYIARYEREIASEGDIEKAIEELTYFRNELIRLHQEKELYDDELIDLKGFVNTIITHIANGNKNEERLVNIMGGTIIETESEKLVRQGRAQMIIELGQEEGLDDAIIIERLQKKVGLSLEKAKSYLAQYGKQLA